MSLIPTSRQAPFAAKGLALCFVFALAGGAFAQSPDVIGMFDLKEIRSVPLDPEVLSRTKQGDVTVEQVRFTAAAGVKMVATLTYKDGAKAAPGYAFLELFKVKPLVAEAQAGFVGVVLDPPTGNTDPKKAESLGGPIYPQPFDFNSQFLEDKSRSYIYQVTVGMVRLFDYLATRPEVNLSTSIVTSYSWASTMIGLMHALDDRPAGYVLFHGCGYYVDPQGLSAGNPVTFGHAKAPETTLSRKLYEMYCPAAYAGFGTKPLYMGTALDDSYTRLDAIQEMYRHLKSPKAFAFSPNREHMPTARNEFNGYAYWVSSWIFGGAKPATLGEGAITASQGHLNYKCSLDSKESLTHAELLVSYGKPGNWLGRTWHRLPMTVQGTDLTAEVPVYDPEVPAYVIAQVETAKFGAIANGPQLCDPKALGISAASSAYPSVLFDPSLKDDLYLRGGNVEWNQDGPNGHGSAIVSPGPEGMIHFQNVDGDLWAGKKTLNLWLKGDGNPGPIRAYLTYSPNYYLEVERKNYTVADLVPTGSTFALGWNEYSIPLSKVGRLAEVSTLFLDSSHRKLQLGPILLKP